MELTGDSWKYFQFLKTERKVAVLSSNFPMPGQYKMIDKTFTYSTYFANLIKIGSCDYEQSEGLFFRGLRRTYSD
jgi:hypothetical protein